MEQHSKGLLHAINEYGKDGVVAVTTLNAVTLQDIKDLMEAYKNAKPPKDYRER
jgi:hypothetical protein